MSTHTETANKAGMSTKPMASTSEMISALKSLRPSGRSQKAAKFAELIDFIKELLAKDVLQKDIIAMLAKNGLSLSPATFKQYLDVHQRQHEAKNMLAATRPDDSLISSAIDSETLQTGHFAVQIDDSAGQFGSGQASGLMATNAKEHVVGGIS